MEFKSARPPNENSTLWVEHFVLDIDDLCACLLTRLNRLFNLIQGGSAVRNGPFAVKVFVLYVNHYAEHAWTALGLGAVIALLLLGIGAGLAALIVAGLAGFAMIRLARARIGGYTGDVLGAIEQLGEIAVLLAAAVLL